MNSAYVRTSTYKSATGSRSQSYCSRPTHDLTDVRRLTTAPGSTSPTLFEKLCGFFYVPQDPDKCMWCETGPTVFRPYPRRLESLTVCRSSSTLFLIILRPWVLDLPGFEPATSRSADRRSPNLACVGGAWNYGRKKERVPERETCEGRGSACPDGPRKSFQLAFFECGYFQLVERLPREKVTSLGEKTVNL